MGSKPKVLFIEDNRDFAYLIASLAGQMGYETYSAYTGWEGVEKARELSPDIIFCDIGLPEMDGFAAVRKIREDPSGGRSRIVALTGYTENWSMESARDAGFDLFVTKPICMAEFSKILDLYTLNAGQD